MAASNPAAILKLKNISAAQLLLFSLSAEIAAALLLIFQLLKLLEY
jgi:hypothetical protein